MKKKNFLLGFFAMAMALVLSASFVSCGDDDDDDKKTENNGGNNGGDNGGVKDDDDDNGGQYLDASISWGASVATIKQYMSGYELLREGDDELIYRGTGTANFYDYYFDGGLVFSEVDLVMDSISKSVIVNKLTSAGYTLVNQTDTTDYYLSSDKVTATSISTSKYYGVYEVRNYDYDWLMEEDEPGNVATWKDPYIVWGASKTAVKNYMSGYEMIGEDDEIIGYEGKDDEDSYWYFFDSAKLVESDVDIPQEITTLSDLYTKLTNDGYQYLGVQPDTVFHFISADQATYIFLVANNYYGINEIAYCDYASLSSSRSMSGQAAGTTMLNYADFKHDKKRVAPKAAKSVKGSKTFFNLKKATLRKALR